MSSVSESIDRGIATDGIERFVPNHAVRILGRSDARDIDAGEVTEAVATIVFIDLRNFTTLSETMEPESVVRFLNDWYGTIEPVIAEYGGFIDKYIGDAALAVFTGETDQAVLCCIEMLRRLERLNLARLAEGRPPLRAGIGMNTGITAFAAIGSPGRTDLTVIGDTVNIAARLESLTRTYGVDLLLSEHAHARLSDPDAFDLRFIDRILVRGKKIPLSIYEAFGGAPDTERAAKKGHLREFDRAVAYYHYGNVSEARPTFERCLVSCPSDGAASEYLRRCVEFEKTGILERAAEMRSYPAWSPEFSVGHDIIDAHHRKLFESVAVLLRMIDADDYTKIGAVIEFLTKYVEVHFRTEEDLMRACSYPFFADHKAQHDRFAVVYASLVRELSAASHHAVYIAFRVRILVVDWLLNHTTKADPHLGRFLARNAL